MVVDDPQSLLYKSMSHPFQTSHSNPCEDVEGRCRCDCFLSLWFLRDVRQHKRVGTIDYPARCVIQSGAMPRIRKPRFCSRQRCRFVFWYRATTSLLPKHVLVNLVLFLSWHTSRECWSEVEWLSIARWLLAGRPSRHAASLCVAPRVCLFLCLVSRRGVLVFFCHWCFFSRINIHLKDHGFFFVFFGVFPASHPAVVLRSIQFRIWVGVIC